METKTQLEAVNALKDWSKWLIGMNTLLGGSCLSILEISKVWGLSRLFIVLAIICFLASVLCAIGLTRMLASLIEHLPSTESIYQFRDEPGFSVRQLARLQLLAFLLASLFMGLWLLLKLG